MQIQDFINTFGNLIATLMVIGATYGGYRQQKTLERKERSHQQKLEKYEIFMRSLFGLYSSVKDSKEEETQMKKEFIINFYRIHLSCSADIIHRIGTLLEAVKEPASKTSTGHQEESETSTDDQNQTKKLTDLQKNKLTLDIINSFRKDLNLSEVNEFNHYGWD